MILPLFEEEESLMVKVTPLLTVIALSLPLLSWQFVFDKLYKGVNDTKDLRDSVIDYGGISLADTTEGWGPYTNEILVGQDKEHGFDIKLPEIRRFEQTLIVGVSGAGKTSLVFEPWVAQDIGKKFFYKESSHSFLKTDNVEFHKLYLLWLF